MPKIQWQKVDHPFSDQTDNIQDKLDGRYYIIEFNELSFAQRGPKLYIKDVPFYQLSNELLKSMLDLD